MLKVPFEGSGSGIVYIWIGRCMCVLVCVSMCKTVHLYMCVFVRVCYYRKTGNFDEFGESE